MNIKLIKIGLTEIDKLKKMMQLYLHDLNSNFSIDFNSDRCEYEYDLSSYFEKNIGYFIKSENKILGFVLVDINSNSDFELSEMFVLNNYKGKSIGTKAVKMIFDLYKGNWVIKAVPNSVGAENFWKKVVEEYTNNNYKILHTGKYNRAELYFISK